MKPQPKQRIAVIRLFSGGYLSPEGQRTNSLTKAIKCKAEDVAAFLTSARPQEKYAHHELLWGASVEWLPKRKYAADVLTPAEELRRLSLTLQRQRLWQQMHRYRALASEYRRQARWAEEQAAIWEAKADVLTADLETATHASTPPK